ncbi:MULTISPECIES: hypothetical protein [unclassified Mesorhizobium]|uniref:hypothetical protein n=1 Tax=unclassified Mesorhizobium TaxID=325217 RepID=UPI000FDB0C94|nr:MULTISPECIES: hypothetical protein [unclassified Mesorhizobium]TGT76722.1 hypothetical protein EN809_003720 [Mesorhizobium sp. M2E.F.Ca.ET.166.01.1.1]TGW02834.1 hypothetical protein EN797_003720 [Mesorhizobium sp. M2E.F.Ca.ET.154.01.1.1]
MLRYSTSVRNAKLDAIEDTVGASAVLKIRSGSPPANCAAADTGTVLASIDLPADWMAPAAAAVKVKAGTWQDASADANGTAGHFRIYDGLGVCHIQGSYGTSGADMIGSSTSFSVGQPFTVNSFTLADNNG